jgi:lipopolysaccharide biosynthesis glycosyltransferase
MKISIPEKIKSEIDVIETVYLETENTNAGEKSPAFVGSIISDKHIRAVPFVVLHNSVYDACSKIQYRILYKNGITEVLKFTVKQNALYRSGVTSGANLCIRNKKSDIYNDTDEDRKKCLDGVEQKILNTFDYSDAPIGAKNLIYYTVYFDKGYTELLELSINSILKNSKINFDILIITDEPTKKLIDNLSFNKKISPKFLITETPFDGVVASQNKTRVFEYESINEYNNILFLDCDIVCIKDVNTIFKQNLKTDTLYTAYNLNLNYSHHKTFHHGFEMLTDDFVSEMRINKQMPFNAGQFLFKNSERMREHFNNVCWFMENWAGEYFFEQAFMCYYFCKAYLTDSNVLQKHMSIVSTVTKSEYKITKDTCLVHFIAPPLDAKTKSEFIKNFQKEQKSSFFENITSKIKSLFKKLFKKHEQPFTY